ncbi:MAG: hypothetical protein Q4G60_13300 [bacterium]|nr:hypothetical protein [bacterium]
MKEVKHIIRFGTNADQTTLYQLNDTYDMIIINANMLAHTTDAVSNFLLKNICTHSNKGYFIDPLTYAFQDHLELLHSKPTKEETRIDPYINLLDRPLKPPFVKLIEIYGDMTNSIHTNQPLSTEDFLDGENTDSIHEFCKKVMDYQVYTVENSLRNNDVGKYLEYCGEKLRSNLLPEFVIAPYFYITKEEAHKWLKINTDLCDYCAEIADYHLDVWAQVIIDKEILQDQYMLELIADRYTDARCKGVILWIDDFVETKAKQCEIDNYFFLLNKLRGKPVYQAYGGFFSILMTNKSVGLLNGVSHGLEYGEDRRGYPVGGGLPSSKFYFLPLHRRLDYSLSYDLLESEGYIDINEKKWGLSDKYQNDVCKCKRCRSLMPEYMIGFKDYSSSKPYNVEFKTHTQRRLISTKEEKENCRFHYMYCKKMEFILSQRKSLKAVLKEIEDEIIKYKGAAGKRINLENISQWVNAFKSYEGLND